MSTNIEDDIKEIKSSQVKMAEAHGKMVTSQAVLSTKIDGWMTATETAKEANEKEHDILFTKVRLVVKWPHLATAVFVLSAIVGIVWKLASGGG